MAGESIEPGKGFTGPDRFAAAKELKRPPRPSLDRREERRLVAAARGGDRRALERLLQSVSGTVYRYGRSFCRDPHDAEDVMQDVLTALIGSLGELRGDAALSTWAFVVARRTCARRRRRAARFASLESGPGRAAMAIADTAASPARVTERGRLRVALERAIAALPAAQRDVLLLRDVEGRSAAEVAKALRLGERAVKSRLHRARLAVRAALAPWAEPGSPAPGEGCPDTARMLSRFLEGELSAAACARIRRHVNGCAACGGACDGLRAALGECREWSGRAIPGEIQARLRAAIRAVVAETGPNPKHG